MDEPITGGCGCGAVRFEIDEPFLSAGYRHCTRCQRRSGTAASANARAKPGSVRIVRGRRSCAAGRRRADEKVFCVRCGSALFSCEPGSGDFTGVRLGAVDDDPGIRPQSRSFVGGLRGGVGGDPGRRPASLSRRRDPGTTRAASRITPAQDEPVVDHDQAVALQRAHGVLVESAETRGPPTTRRSTAARRCRTSLRIETACARAVARAARGARGVERTSRAPRDAARQIVAPRSINASS